MAKIRLTHKGGGFSDIELNEKYKFISGVLQLTFNVSGNFESSEVIEVEIHLITFQGEKPSGSKLKEKIKTSSYQLTNNEALVIRLSDGVISFRM